MKPDFRRGTEVFTRPAVESFLLVVDGNNLLIRAERATERAGMVVEGVNTGALVAFANSMARYVREERPSHLLVVWDSPCEWRRVVYEGYKARRWHPEVSGRHEDPESVFGLARAFLGLTGVAQGQADGFEADDVIAYQHQAKPAGQHMVILTGDKDLLQLVDADTEVIAPGDPERWTPERVLRSYGCPADQLCKAMALSGDAIDDIPGIPGIGVKTAVKLLARNGWDIDKAMQSEPKLQGASPQVSRNLKLVDLRQVPFAALAKFYGPFRAPAFRPVAEPSPELLLFLRHYRLKSIEDRMQFGTFWGRERLQA